MSERAALVEALARGLMQAVLATETPPDPILRKRPAKRSRRPRGDSPFTPEAAAPIGGHAIEPQEFPLPGFDHEVPADFKLPPMTLAQMEAAVERLRRGDGPPPGFYDPEEADTSVPLS